MGIKETLEKYNIPCPSSLEETLEKYMLGVLEWNEKVNLTAIKEEDEFIVKHYVDSLSIMEEEEVNTAKRIIDVGTGGGFPGIPLAAAFPDKDFTLLDSLDKRLKIIDALTKEIGIDNVRTLHMRAEDAGRAKEYRETFDLCVSRAVAELRILSEYSIPFVKVGGFFIAYKGADSSEEIALSQGAIEKLGGRIKEIKESTTGQRIVKIEKIKTTPLSYPRKAGTPKKKPL